MSGSMQPVDKIIEVSSDAVSRSFQPNSYAKVKYNQMMDESKQTEEADISRSDFTETH